MLIEHSRVNNMADGFVGAKLKITTSDGSYIGTVHTIDTTKRKLTLSNVVACSSGRKLHGFHHFYGHELDNLELLEQQPVSSQKGKETNQEPQNSGQTRGPQVNPVPAHQQEHSSSPGLGRGRAALGRALKDAGVNYGISPGRKNPQRKSMFRDVSDGGRSLLQRAPLVAEKYLADDPDESDELRDPQNPPEFIQIDEFGEAFEHAVKFIKTQHVIGVSPEGVHLGRHGRLCWLVIACRKYVYLFDILTLGAGCFEEGLQELLESGDILKVIHDCRQLSDALFHQYDVKLVNVFDTQVADIIIFKNEKGGELPRNVNGLVACMYEYLNLSPELLHFQKVRKKHMQMNPSVWADRPLSDALLDSIGKHAMYLRELRHAQMERLMAEFIYGVDIYLGVARDAKFPRDPTTTNAQLPSQFKELKRFRYRHRSRRFDDEYNDAGYQEIPEEPTWSHAAWMESRRPMEERGPDPAPATGEPAGFSRAHQSEAELSQFQNASDGEDFDSRKRIDRHDQATLSSDFHNLSLGEEQPSVYSAQALGRTSTFTSPDGLNTVDSRPANTQPIFSNDDFPPLSGSDSDSVGTPSFSGRASRAAPSSGSARAPSPLSTVVETTAGTPGRGRASALLRHAMLPAARLPGADPMTRAEQKRERRMVDNMTVG